MSDYEYDDPNRADNGTFHNLYGTYNANSGEQWSAGVNEYDNLTTANLKVQNNRMAQGLDPYTGQPNANPYVPSYSYAGGSGSTPERALSTQEQARLSEDLREGNSRLGHWLGGIMKWCVVYPALAVAGFFGLWLGLRSADATWMRASPTGGVVRLALQQTFPEAALPLVSALATPKEIAEAMAPEALFAGASTPLTHANAKKKVDQGDARRGWLDLSAYLCEIDVACRAKAREVGPEMAARVFNWSTEYLVEKARHGNAHAAATLCVFPLLLDPDQSAAELAWNVCSYAVYNAKITSHKPREMLAQMQQQTWFSVARWAATDPALVIQRWARSVTAP